MIDTISARGHDTSQCLGRGAIGNPVETGGSDSSLNQRITANIIAVWFNVVVFRSILLLRNSQKESATVGRGAVLTVDPEVIATNEGLQACADIGVTIILTELDSLVNPSVAITKVGRLRVAQVNTEAFGGEADCTSKVDDTVVGKDVRRTQAGDDDLAATSETRQSYMRTLAAYIERFAKAITRIVKPRSSSFDRVEETDIGIYVGGASEDEACSEEDQGGH